MRIIPWELFSTCPTLSLEALRKELFMYDYSLLNNKPNQAMDLFLVLGRPYFNFVVKQWVKEMIKRNLYVNSFFRCYADNQIHQKAIITDWWLIFECIIQWDLKGFKPYELDQSWFQIALNFKPQELKLSIGQYQDLKDWYRINYMKLNHSQLLKPYRLNLTNSFKSF